MPANLEQQAQQAESVAQKAREKANEEENFIGGFESTVLLLAHLTEQVTNLVHLVNGPKTVERDSKGKALRIING